MIKEKGDLLTLLRTVEGSPTHGWEQGSLTTYEYTFYGFVRPVDRQYVNGETVLMTDLIVVAETTATHTKTNGVAVSQTTVSLSPVVNDQITIDGTVTKVKVVLPAPAGGSPSLYRLVVGA